MPQRCSICSHPKRKQIDALYVTHSVRQIVARFSDLSTGAVVRHKKHIKNAVVAAERSTGRSFADYFMEMWDQAIAEYKLAGNSMEKATWFRERRGLLETGARLGMQRQQEGRLYTGLDVSIKEVWDGLDDRS